MVAKPGPFWHRWRTPPAIKRPIYGRPGLGCGCSSGVEHNLAKVGVEGSNPFARSKKFLVSQRPLVAPRKRRSAAIGRMKHEVPGSIVHFVHPLLRVRAIRAHERFSSSLREGRSPVRAGGCELVITVRNLYLEALAQKTRDVPWREIREHLIARGHDIGHSQIAELGGGNRYELTFETGEKISFDGVDYQYTRS